MANDQVEQIPVDMVGVQILLKCKEIERNHDNQCPPSIFKVPSVLRDISSCSFNPQVVSIGPLHREDGNLKEFEARKLCYLNHLFESLKSPPEQTLKECVQKVEASIEKIKECYGGIVNCEDALLVEMMVIDASFILGFISLSSGDNQFLYLNKVVHYSVTCDLLLLENQIPFFVLQDIFDCTLKKIDSTTSLTSILYDTLKFLNPFPDIEYDVDHTTFHHILGFLHTTFYPKNHMSPSDPPTNHMSPSDPPRLANHSALELNKAGVKFKTEKDPKWYLAMEFKSSWFACFCWSWGKPTFRMPILQFADTTELVLRNLIAYEQCTPDVPYYISSYVFAIDMLVDTQNDVMKLVESKVFVNLLGSNEEAATLINKICKEVIVEEFYYIEQWQQLDHYFNGFFPKHIAWLRRTYFSSPWSFIALLAAIILFGLTMVQTIFSIKAA